MDLESDIDTLLNGQEIPGVKQAEWTSASCLCHPAEGLGTPSSFQNKLEKERTGIALRLSQQTQSSSES